MSVGEHCRFELLGPELSIYIGLADRQHIVSSSIAIRLLIMDAKKKVEAKRAEPGQTGPDWVSAWISY
jgi:hypothetical protein